MWHEPEHHSQLQHKLLSIQPIDWPSRTEDATPSQPACLSSTLLSTGGEGKLRTLQTDQPGVGLGWVGVGLGQAQGQGQVDAYS